MPHRILFLPLIALLGSCAVTGGWQLKQDNGGIQLYMQEYPDSAIPEFRATVKIHSTLEKTMMVLTDFSRCPDWVYQCKAANVIELVDFTEAYIYQIIDLPVVRDRDILIHGRTIRGDSGDDMWIEMNAAPDYCDNNDSEVCRKTKNSNLVRITQSTGSFHVKQIDKKWVEVTWQQHFDPGGLIPDWAARLKLGEVPVKSLSRLKAILEHES